MSDPLEFFVQGECVPQGSHTPAVTKDGRPYLRESNSQRLRPWRKTVKAAAKEAMAGRDKFGGPLAVSLMFALHRPQSHEGTRTWPSVRPDFDKLTRAACDSMTGAVYYDDGQIVSATIRKVWAVYDVDYPPGLLVWVDHVAGFCPPARVLH